MEEYMEEPMTTPALDLTKLQMPVVFRWKEPMSDDELLAFARCHRPFQFERNREGEIIVMTVGGIGGAYESYVSSMLFLWNEEARAGTVFSSSTAFSLSDGSCLSPDAAWVAGERWNALTARQQTGFPPLCPDFLIEIRSPSDARAAVEKKMQRWMENGARLAWLIDPMEKEVMIYAAGEPTETLEKPEDVRGHGPVAGFHLSMGRLWS